MLVHPVKWGGCSSGGVSGIVMFPPMMFAWVVLG